MPPIDNRPLVPDVDRLMVRPVIVAPAATVIPVPEIVTVPFVAE